MTHPPCIRDQLFVRRVQHGFNDDTVYIKLGGASKTYSGSRESWLLGKLDRNHMIAWRNATVDRGFPETPRER